MSNLVLCACAVLIAFSGFVESAQPGKPTISWMPSTATQGESRTIEWNMWWGPGGKRWELLVNGASASQHTDFTINNAVTSDGAQQGKVTVTISATSTYVVRLCNQDGCVDSDASTVTVQGGSVVTAPVPPTTTVPPTPVVTPNPSTTAKAPGNPVIAWMSPTVSSGTSVTVKWDMWWGQRGDKWALVVNGTKSDYYTVFTVNGPLSELGPQGGSVDYTISARTTFGVELCNGSVCTTSASSYTVDVTAAPTTQPVTPPTQPVTPPTQPVTPPTQPVTPPTPVPVNPGYPCAGVVPGKPETVSQACLNLLDTIKFGGDKLVPGTLGQLPVDSQGKAMYEAYGYYVEWAPYGRKFPISKVNAAQYSMLLFAFLRLMPDGTLKVLDDWATFQAGYGMTTATGSPVDLYNWEQGENARGHMLALTYLKARFPHLKTAFSVGGWTLSGQFSSVMANDVTRATFVRSCLEFANKWGFDGIDIDWEYPVTGGNTDSYLSGVAYLEKNPGAASDAASFIKMLQDLRAAIDAETTVNPRTKTGKKVLSTAMGMNPRSIDALDYPKFIDLVDTLNLMTYDFNGGWSPVASHNSPLYDNNGASVVGKGGDELQAEFNCFDGILNILWNIAGVKGMRKPKHSEAERRAVLTAPTSAAALKKMVMGVPYYGRSWTSSAAVPTSTIFDPWFVGSPAKAGSFETGVWDSSDVLFLRDGQIQKMSAGGRAVSSSVTSATWVAGAWDERSCAGFAWANAGGAQQLITYNDEDSLQAYGDFVATLKMGGTMVWEMDGDTHEDGSYVLSRSVMYGLNKQQNNIYGQKPKDCKPIAGSAI